MKKSVEPRTSVEPPARGIQNVPRPTPLAGRGHKTLLLYEETLPVFDEAEYLMLTHQFLMDCQSLLVILQTLLPPGQDNPSQRSIYYVTTQQAHGNKKLR